MIFQVDASVLTFHNCRSLRLSDSEQLFRANDDINQVNWCKAEKFDIFQTKFISAKILIRIVAHSNLNEAIEAVIGNDKK